MRRLTPLLLLLSGCVMGPDYERPDVPIPEDYRETILEAETITNTPWWELFNDPQLDLLIEEALENNRDLREAVARIDEANAALVIVKSDLYPIVNYGGNANYGGTFGDVDDTGWSGAVSAGALYHVDLWGRIRRANEAALQELLATEWAYRGVMIRLVADMASSYFLLLDLDNRVRVSERTALTRSEYVDVIRTRFSAGMVTEVDLNQAEIQLYEAEASVQVFERLRKQTENSISTLLGRPPTAIDRGLPLQEQVMPPEIPTGLPSELLERRPDVVAAERRLHAQTARIGVAEALLFPQFDLTADLGATFNGGNNGIFGLGAQLFGPLFNAGANLARVDVERARTEQLLNSYEQTILSAYREVSDALIEVRTYQAEYEFRRQQLEAAENAERLAWVRYDGGKTSYLEVLELQRAFFASQLTASETFQRRLTAFVRLYQALGGGWIEEETEVPAEQTTDGE